MILGCQEKITFYEEEVEEEVEEYEDFDFLFYEMLYDVREILLKILQNRTWSMNARMEVAASMAHKVQEKINEYDTFLIDEIIQEYEEISSYNEVELAHSELLELEEASVQYKRIQSNIMELYQLEVLQQEWRPYLMSCQTLLYERTFEDYQEWKGGFQKQYQDRLERMKEQLMIYFVYSYFCGAVYDGEALSKYQLAHITTCIIEELWLAKYMENQGKLSELEMQRITYGYAREIEHSDQNLEILEELYKKKVDKMY